MKPSSCNRFMAVVTAVIPCITLAATSSVLLIPSARAATYDWTGATDGNFTTGGNWVGGGWTQWDDYRFGGTPANTSITIDGYFGIGSLTLQSGLTQDIVINSSNAQPIIMGTDQSSSLGLISIAADSRNLTINGEYISSTAVRWEVGSGRTITLNGSLNNWYNPATLVKSGAGTAVLTQTSNYTGGTTVNGGILSLSNGDWVTGQPWNGSGSTGAFTLGAGTVLSTSDGVTMIKGGLTLNGGTVSSRGNFYGTGNGSWGNLLLGSNISAGNSASSSISSEIRLDGDRTIDVGGGSTLSLSGGLSISPFGGNYGITKTGTGTLALSGANGYNGQTIVVSGTLLAASSTALGQGGHNGTTMSFIYDGATLALQGGISLDEHFHVWGSGVGGLGAVRSISGNNALTDSPGGGPGYCLRNNTTVGVEADTLSVAGFYQEGGSFSLTKIGEGTLTLTAPSSYSGATTVNGGTLKLQNSCSSSSFTVASGKVLELNGGWNGESTTFSGQGTLRKTGAGGVVWGAGSTTFAMSAGSWIDVQEGSMTGGSNANENWSGNLSGLNVANGASFHGVEANIRVDALTGAGTITSGYPGAGYQNFTFGVNNGSGTFSGSLTDSDTAAANFVKAGSGTQTLTDTLNYDGTTTVSGGTLELPDGDWRTGGLYSSGSGASGTIIVGAGATLSTSAGVTGLQNGLTLNGGTVSSRGLVHSNYRNLLLESNITAGGAATSTISSEISLRGSYSMIVGSGSTLNITGGIADDGFGNGSQGITKAGTGTLKLTATNTYTGNTTVSQGELILGDGSNNTSLSNSADLSVASGATLQLDYSVGNTDTIDELWLGGVQQSPGVYGAGTYSGVTITGTGTLTVLNGPPADPFANWMSTNYPAIVSPNNQPGADPDNDGIANLVEYLLQGGNPSVNTSNSLPTVSTSGANFVFTYFRRAAASGTTQTFEYGTDLDGWTSVAIPGGSGVTVSDQGGGIDKVEISVAKGSNSSLFGRLKVVK